MSLIESGHQTWMSSKSNVYDQICYDSILTDSNNNNNSRLTYCDQSPPYTPSYTSEETTDHYYYRLPTPATLITNEIMPLKTQNSQQCNSKRELHKELIYRQKM